MSENLYSLQEITQALKNREFTVHYQPQYDALTNELKSAEALARWQLSDGRIVMPGSFIPVLESSSEILELDWYILNEVCRFLSAQEEKISAAYRSPSISQGFISATRILSESLSKPLTATESPAVSLKWK